MWYSGIILNEILVAMLPRMGQVWFFTAPHCSVYYSMCGLLNSLDRLNQLKLNLFVLLKFHWNHKGIRYNNTSFIHSIYFLSS